MTARFTIDGSDALETALAELCARAKGHILRVIPPQKVQALLLGGGYGRGEGGVLRTAQGDKPYNDLEFYILHASPDLVFEKLYHSAVHRVAEELTASAGIEVEFKLLSLQKLQKSPVTMFYYDLVTGHRIVYGTDGWLAGCEQHRSAHRIPVYEATRLLMNRCSGLLYAKEKLARSTFILEDSDFVGRNLAKARLALGDVILAMRGQYHWSCRERQKRLRKLEAEDPSLTSIVPLHAQGVDFKLHPTKDERPAEAFRPELDYLSDLARELWLTLESRRLNKEFSSISKYAFSSANKCPETNPRRNRFINARRFGMTGLLETRYPRERLLNTLPLLLWETANVCQKNTLQFIQKQLRTRANDFSALVRAYESLWRLYN
jgi:hypothetical protein